MATRLLIDSFEFQGFEVPDSITLGGSQSLAIHKLPGGVKIIDSMGRDDAPLEWSGIFTGSDALNRVNYLDSWRVRGQIHKLTIGINSYNIVIKEFRPKFERSWHIPYRIVCEVVEDLSYPTTVLLPSKSLDTAITGQITNAVAAVAKLKPSLIGSIATALKNVQGAIANVQSVMTSAMQGIASVVNLETAVITTIQGAITDALITINGCEALINSGMSQLSALFASPAGSGPSGTGIDSGASIGGQSASQLNAWQIDAVNQDTLSQIKFSLTVVNKNLGYIKGVTNATQVVVSGGSLVSLALEYYGDATQWPVIAAANNLSDPVISGQQTITIPASATTPVNQGGGGDLDHWIGSDISLTSRNDIATATGTIQKQQRILRRVLTNPGEYLWHPAYGAGAMQHIGNSDANLPAIEGLIVSQAQLETGVSLPSVAFDVSGDDVTANIQYTDQKTDSLQFLTFTVSP